MTRSWPGLVERPGKDLPAFLAAVEQGHDHSEVGRSSAAQNVAGESRSVEQTLPETHQEVSRVRS